MRLPSVRKRLAPFTAAMIALSVVAGAHSALAASYDAAQDFSKASNPNGVWSYGTNTGLFTFTDTESGLDVWHAGAGSLPWVAHNGTASAITFSTVTVPAGGLTLHPGPQGQLSEVIFTAPTTGLYSVNAAFIGEDFVGPTSTDVHVNVNGSTALFDSFVNAYGSGPSYANSSLALNAGDKLEFTVGFGPNNNYYYDSTGFDAAITNVTNTAVPEPSAFAVFGVGAILICACFRRRQAFV